MSKIAQSLVCASSRRPKTPTSKGGHDLRTYTNSISSRRGSGDFLQECEIEGQRLAEHSFSDAAIRLKRRKTFHSGSIASDPSDSTMPYSSPAVTEHNLELLRSAQRVKASGPPVINTPAKSIGRANGIALGKTGSRISHEGRIQKPKHQAHRDMRLLSAERNEHMVRVLRNQVFKHIKAAISRYYGSLTIDDRKSIGTKVAI